MLAVALAAGREASHIVEHIGRRNDVTTGSDVARAAHHATEAERLLAGRFGFITNFVKAQVHASLAIYYATRELNDHR